MKYFLSIILALTLALICTTVSLAEEIKIIPIGDSREEKELKLPYAFSSEIFGASVGYVYSVIGYPQPQSMVLATAMAGSKGSGMLFLMGRDIRIFGAERLFMDPILSTGYFVDNNAYINGNPDFTNERAGSNDSDKDNYITGSGMDNFVRINFKYLLPIGNGRELIVNGYQLKEGLLESGDSGGECLNPLASGRTFLQARPFYRSKKIDSDDVDSELRTNGLDLSLFWDNRNFPVNPTKGNSLQLKGSRDFGAFNSSNAWTSYTAEMDKYISLGASDTFRQRVIAFDLWTANSPSWETNSDGSIDNRPPAYSGATLGGLWRMRAYPSQRFSDKAAIYYGAEYRMIPKWNPFLNWPRLQKHVGIQWLQFVPFVEVSRVAPSWSLDELHSEMKWDAGLGLRAMAKGLVIRIDLAGCEEGGSVQMMVGQPFQF